MKHKWSCAGFVNRRQRVRLPPSAPGRTTPSGRAASLYLAQAVRLRRPAPRPCRLLARPSRSQRDERGSIPRRDTKPSSVKWQAPGLSTRQRGFDSRRRHHTGLAKRPSASSTPKSGRFDSCAPYQRAGSSKAERPPDAGKAGGSIPPRRTDGLIVQRADTSLASWGCGFDSRWVHFAGVAQRWCASLVRTRVVVQVHSPAPLGLRLRQPARLQTACREGSIPSRPALAA